MPSSVPQDKPLYLCVECAQPYWWNNNANSRSSRALSLADRLFTAIQSGLGQPITGSVCRDSNGNIEVGSFTMRTTVVMGESELAEEAEPTTEVTDANEDVLHFASAHATLHHQEPEFTNWSDDFKGNLDYIFLTNDWEIESVHVFPSSANSLSLLTKDMIESLTLSGDAGIESPLLARIESYLPNEVFPSDHILIKAVLALPAFCPPVVVEQAKI